MARKKVNHQWISNNTTRRATYKRRYQGLVSKISVLSALCGIKTCMVVYSEGNTQPEVWPSDAEAKQLIKKFKDMPDVGRFKKIKNHEEFLKNHILRIHEKVRKLDHENRKRETMVLLHDSLDGRHPGLVGTTKEELLSLREMVDMKINKAKARLQQLVVGQGALPKPLEVMLPVSSSSQT